MESVSKTTTQNKMDPMTSLLFYPWNELVRIEDPPHAMDVSDAILPLLRQAESVATTLLCALESAPQHDEPAERFTETARVLEGTLRAAVNRLTAWDRHDGVPKPQEDRHE